MSVKVRQYKKRGKSGWEVDIMFKWPDGELYRERVKAPVGSKSGAKAWGEQRQSELLSRGRVSFRQACVMPRSSQGRLGHGAKRQAW
jgi:hypothetical protein